ncbi:MAG: Uma2 family endonuclease, partial [Acidimicrobiales bacterium]
HRAAPLPARGEPQHSGGLSGHLPPPARLRDRAPGPSPERPRHSVDLRLGPADVYAPDLWWVREERRPGPGDLRLDGLPDIVAEVRSPSTWRYDIGRKDIGRKLARYESGGVHEVWLVDTESRSVLVYRRTSPDQPQFDEAVEVEHGDALTSPLLPAFALPLADLFSP